MATDKAADDNSVLTEYRIDAGFVVGYVIAYAGILFLGWDPHYLFLGVALEIALANIGLIVRVFMTARKVPPIVVGTILCLPALVACIVFGIMPVQVITKDTDLGSISGALVLGGFFLSTLYSEWQRFRRVTLPQARFTRYFDDKYVFEDGRPVFNGFSHIMSSVIGSWLLTGIFMISWLVAAGVGAIQTEEGDLSKYSILSAVVLLSLCLLRQLATIGILHQVYRNGPSQEELWLKTFSQAGNIVVRNEQYAGSTPTSSQS